VASDNSPREKLFQDEFLRKPDIQEVEVRLFDCTGVHIPERLNHSQTAPIGIERRCQQEERG
jgi:hypothetical protein